ncbi:hypothetical protein HYS00_01655 [Candidatus Microgenomates bacterium]|nr:hypothetical protein [Candidatus Microgenomates bacterium]
MSHERLRNIGMTAGKLSTAAIFALSPLTHADVAYASDSKITLITTSQPHETSPFNNPVPQLIDVAAGVGTAAFILKNRARSANAQETMTKLQRTGDRLAEVGMDLAATAGFAVIVTIASRL